MSCLNICPQICLSQCTVPVVKSMVNNIRKLDGWLAIRRPNFPFPSKLLSDCLKRIFFVHHKMCRCNSCNHYRHLPILGANYCSASNIAANEGDLSIREHCELGCQKNGLADFHEDYGSSGRCRLALYCRKRLICSFVPFLPSWRRRWRFSAKELNHF